MVVAYAGRSYGQRSIPHDRSTSRGGTLRAGRSGHVARRGLVEQYALPKSALAGRDVTSGVEHVGIFRLCMAKLSFSCSREIFFNNLINHLSSCVFFLNKLFFRIKPMFQCIAILEAKLRELWLRSEALAEMMMTVEVCDTNVNTLTNALDLDAADIPLLLAVATTHSPEITQRFGFTLT